MKTEIIKKRVLLKLSGESLTTPNSFGIDAVTLNSIALTISNIRKTGVQLALVVGGGNIFRGLKLSTDGIARTSADQMGMLATLMNGVALHQALLQIGVPSKIFTALDCPKVAASFNLNEALTSLEKGEVVIFVGGTGNPYFTTDTAAALRASEIGADVFLKATKVDGIFDKDPKTSPDAKMYQHLTYTEALAKDLKVMDATSIALCREGKIPIFVFNMKLLNEQHFSNILNLKASGTLVSQEA